ncbi:MAG: hypothetical protein ACTHOJ_16400 [Sphingomonas oligoaromativorans]|jgi:hypothetical protein|uniref:hypothetical protein n=1 Tax=Sphingomonas oligoaromativorans TaxID=575322 RepID=UPI00142434C2|nr:hypothetical protein [Sphingomonas oligoaromativorans]NIJ33541.1 peptidoglycan/LPS O-acetylase OafA/YrhL [Sphingomonas oligoaromativorans]
MVIALIFDTLLLIALIAAIWRGGTIERLGAALCILATVLTVVSSPLRIRFQGVRLDLLTIDMATLLAFVALARASRRFWPIWAAGLQMLSIICMTAEALAPDNLAYAYAEQVWSWGIVVLIVVVSLRHDATSKGRGSSRNWSEGPAENERTGSPTGS